MNFIKSSRFSRRLAKVSHPVSKYNESLLANFEILHSSDNVKSLQGSGFFVILYITQFLIL
jgi:hypothetical protein